MRSSLDSFSSFSTASEEEEELLWVQSAHAVPFSVAAICSKGMEESTSMRSHALA